MAKITILGAGVMGSAFTIPLTDNGHEVNLVGTHLDEEIIEQVHEDRYHPQLGAYLSEQVQPFTYDRLGEALVESEMLVLGVNSLGIDWAGMILSMLGDEVALDMPLLFLTKGLEGKNDGNHWFSKDERLRILPDTLRDSLMPHQAERLQIMAVGGPSIAGELSARRHTSVVLAGPEQTLLDHHAALLRTPYYHVWTSTDLVGVEVCVALKNIYALAVGLAQGLLEREESLPDNQAAMYNPAAAIFAQALHETSYLVDYLGGEQKTILGMAGAGDLYVTCQGGRNSRMGRLLGMGMRYTDAKTNYMPNETIEGAELALAIGRSIEFLVLDGKLDGARLPLLRMMTDVVCNDGVADVPWDQFFYES